VVKTGLPIPDCFVTEFIATHQKHPDQVTQTKLEQQTEDDDLEHYIGGELQPIEGCAAAFIESVPTCPAAESTVAQIRCTT